MKKFEGILFCTDLDGTLLKKDKTVSYENLEAIEYFKSEGGIFTFVTGRMPIATTEFCKTINPNAPYGCINGGGIYDHRKNEYLWKKELPRSAFEFLDYVDKNIPQIGFQVNTFDTIYFCKENPAMEEFRRLTKTPNITLSCEEINEPIAKILFGDLSEQNIKKLMDLLKSHPLSKNYDFVRSAKILYEILPKGITKATSLLKLAEILDIDIKKTIAVGDYNNDVPLIKTAHVGFAVSNAVPEAKAVADFITVSNEEHAICKIIEDLDKGIISM